MDKEGLNKLYILLIFSLCFLCLALIATRPLSSFDGYWHLQMGKDLLENGLSPWIDHYSFSYASKEISDVPVLFQILLHIFVSTFGESNGFYFVKIFYVTLLMLTLYAYFRYIKAHWVVVFLLLSIITYYIHMRLMIRPEIFSNILVVLSLVLYLRAKKSFVTKEIVWICLLLLFWVNYHSPIMGYVIFFGLFLDKAIDKYFYKDKSFTWAQWLSWGMAIFLVGFINHSGEHFFILFLFSSGFDFGVYTREYMASYPVFSKNMLVHAVWLISTYIVIWSLIKKQYGFAFIVALLTYFSWTTVRLVSVAMLINLCILAVYLNEYIYTRSTLTIRKSIKNFLAAVVVGVSVLAYILLFKESFVTTTTSFSEKERLHKERYPVEVVDYLNRYQEEGNVLNLMELGGFLINKLSPGFKVFIDGRTNILYPFDFFKYNLYLLDNTDELNKAVKTYDVKYALYKNEPAVLASLQKNETLKLNFSDGNFLLFSEKNKHAFPRSSMLMMFPSCWSGEWALDIEKEIELSEELFAERNYELKYVLQFMKDYLSHDDKKKFFNDLQLEDISSDGVRRVALYLALDAGSKEVADEIFKSFRSLTEYDYLVHAYNLALKNEYTKAEDLLHYFYTMKKFVRKEAVSFDNISIMIHVLDMLEKNNALHKFEPAYKLELGTKLKLVNHDPKSTEMFNHICGEK